MIVCKTKDELLKNVASKVAHTAEKSLAPMLEQMLQQSAATNAAGAWSRSYGGIASAEKIKSEVHIDSSVTGYKITVTVKDTAVPQEPAWGTFDEAKNAAAGGTLFSQWIEYGEWMDLAAYIESGYTIKPKRRARPFVQKVQKEISRDPSVVVNALKRGL